MSTQRRHQDEKAPRMNVGTLPNCGSISLVCPLAQQKMGGTLSHRETPQRLIIILLKWAARDGGEGEEDKRSRQYSRDIQSRILNFLCHTRALHLKDESATTSAHLLLSMVLGRDLESPQQDDDFVVNPRKGHFLHIFNNFILSTNSLFFSITITISIN